MAGALYHPGLESYVIANHRPFPEITEQPGVPVQPELAEAVGPVLTDFHDRFSVERDDPVPLIVDFGAQGEDFKAIVQSPDEIAALASNFDSEKGAYSGMLVLALGSYIEPALETARFEFTDRKMTVHGPPRATYPESRYQFSTCARAGLNLSEEVGETAEDLERTATDLAQNFDTLTVGREFAEMDLSPAQREHLHWLAVILKGKFLGERIPGSGPWHSRAPEADQLERYRQELTGDMPDSHSAELVPAVFELAQRVADLRRPVTHRVGENYTLTDSKGRVLEELSA